MSLHRTRIDQSTNLDHDEQIDIEHQGVQWLFADSQAKINLDIFVTNQNIQW